MLQTSDCVSVVHAGGRGPALPPSSMVSLKRIAKSHVPLGDVYGRAETDPDYLPDEQRQSLLKERRMLRAIEWVIGEPAPTATGMAEVLGISRATVYRMLAHPRFQVMLRTQLSGRMGMSVQKALATVERTLERGSPLLQLRAATWLLERWDRLCKASGLEEDKDLDDGEARLRVEALIAKLQMQQAMKRLCERDPALAARQGELLAILDGVGEPPDKVKVDSAWLDAELAEQDQPGGPRLIE